MTFTLWYDAMSEPCRSVLYVLKKLGLEHEVINIQAGKYTRTEEFKRDVNPSGLVPVLKHDEDFIYESANILRYLLDGFDSEETLLPRTDLKKRAKVNYWLDWRNTTFRPDSEPAIYTLFVNPLFFGIDKPAEEECKKLLDKWYEKFTFIEKALESNSYLTGEEYTIADLYLYTELTGTKALLKMEVTEKIQEWIDRVEEDTVVKELTDGFMEGLSKF